MPRTEHAAAVSIVDYRPRSTVVAPEHPVPKAKYPVIDIHNHLTITAGNIEQMIREMDELNLRVLVNLSGGSGAAVQRKGSTFIRSSPHKDRFRVFANVNWNGAGTAEWRDREVERAASGDQGRRHRPEGRSRTSGCTHARRTARGSKSTIRTSTRSGRSAPQRGSR